LEDGATLDAGPHASSSLGSARRDLLATDQRRPKARDAAVNDTGLRFGDDVPREVIALTAPASEAIPQERRLRIGEEVT
jgi:hypothetical protein